MTIPVKPFPSYKWRWLSVLPTEGLLEAPVFLGVLRALQHHDGESYKSSGLREELATVQSETGTDTTLDRDTDRNLFRNSGQYWRGTGLLSNTRGTIKLTELGERVASGSLSKDQFASLMVRNTVLPNPLTNASQEMGKWLAAGLRIKPFELILAVMDTLGRKVGIADAFLTPTELTKVLIPLAGQKTSVEDSADAVYEYRIGNLDISDWPDCAPASNDNRLAREFLLFLENFDICRTDDTFDRYNQRFFLGEVLANEIVPESERSFLDDINLVEEEIAIAQNSEIAIAMERKRIWARSIARPTQPRFRKDVLAAGNSRCILTEETFGDVLDAAHIIPVKFGGLDTTGNGFCMRTDIHRLYDSGKIRIQSDGTVSLHERLEMSISYASLPRIVAIPPAVLRANVQWRDRYL